MRPQAKPGQHPPRRDPVLNGLPFAARQRLWRMQLTLFWEQLWPRLFLPSLVVGLFLVLAGFDLLPLLGRWGHGLAMAGFILALLFTLADLRRLRWPKPADALRRLEKVNGLDHRPLTLSVDQLSIGRADRDTARLWQSLKARQLQYWRRLRVSWPRSSWIQRDPYGLRQALALALVLAVVTADGQFGRNVTRALSPELWRSTPAIPPTIEAWIAPPAYTGLPPVYLSAAGGGQAATESTSPEAPAPNVPVGSKVLAQVTGAGDASSLTIGDDDHPLTGFAPGSYRGEVTLTQVGETTLSLKTGSHEWQNWPINVTPDQPPEVSFTKDPAPTQKAALQLDYQAHDDYGIKSVRVIIRRADGKEGPGSTAAWIDSLPVGSANRKQIQGTSFADLASHPWAGLEVEIFLEAYDVAGQMSRSGIAKITLPERQFTHPVARAVIAQRKRLTQQPEQASNVAQVLHAIAQNRDAYDGKLGVALGLQILENMLATDPAGKEIQKAQGMMWQLAVSLEDEGVPEALQAIRDLQKQLQDAIARGASEEEIQQLTQQLQQAIDQYLQQLARQVQQQLQRGGRPTPVNPTDELTRQDIQDLLNQAQDAALSGQRDQAQNLLNQLQNMLENMAVGIQPGDNGQGGNQLNQLMRQLNNITRRQQQLLDRGQQGQNQQQDGQDSGQQGQDGQGGQGQNGQNGGGQQQGQQAGGGTENDAAEQEALRRDLGDVIQQLQELTGTAPGNFGDAQQFMQQAVDALQQGDRTGAADPQGQAVQLLKEGAQQFLQALRRQQGDPSQSQRGGSAPADSRDPLGRLPTGRGGVDSGDVNIPDQQALQRAREILQELRTRETDRTRSPVELDYIERLLRQF